MYRFFYRLTLCFAILFGVSRASAQRGGDFGRYQVILDQQLLGRPVPEPTQTRPEPPPAAPAPSWATEYRLTMITEDFSSGLARVGLYHIRNQVGYLLIEGEDDSHHGFSLQSVNYARNQAEIMYQGVRHTFSLESGPMQSSPAVTQPSTRPQPPTRTVRRVTRSTTTSISPEPETPPPEPRFRSPEELQAHLQDVQMDAIRTGKPPLPIPLTPEMDAQLVQEGVLPPLEEE